MNKIANILILPALIFCLAPLETYGSANSDASFDEFTKRWPAPQLLMHNDDALKIRLQLLDQAPAGSLVKILTFTFETGESTRLLASHVCQAAARGVKVQFMTDSKYGSVPGELTLFDNEENEELYQRMVNCGAGRLAANANAVEHRIHNHIPAGEGFRIIAGKALPTALYLRDKTAHSPLNRLNHRKLFWVETPGGKSCLIIGGRNLGDHYTAWKHDSFIDGDILVCGNMERNVGNYNDLKRLARGSFEELWNDRDPGGAGIPTTVYALSPNANFQFQKSEPLPSPLALENEVVQGHALNHSYAWQFLRTGWGRDKGLARDEIREEINKMIDREQAEIFIESAYLEYDSDMQAKLEAALARGVKVILIANSLFVSDGPSKLISIVRQPWTTEMLRLYGDRRPQSEIEELLSPNVRPIGGHGNWAQDTRGRFRFMVTTVMSGHMIHFKGAGFKCQKDDQGSFYKSFLLGSHNFHERSGLADKEHALVWREPVDLACAEKMNLPGQEAMIRDLYQPVRGGSAIVMKPEHYDLTEARLAGFYLAHNRSGRFQGAESDLAAFTGASAEEMGVIPTHELLVSGNRPMLFGYRSLRAEMEALGAETLSDDDGQIVCQVVIDGVQRDLCAENRAVGESRGSAFGMNRVSADIINRVSTKLVYQPGTNFEDIPEYKNASKRVINWMGETNALKWIENFL